MAIAYRNVTEAAATATTVVVNKPASLADGDVMFALQSADETAGGTLTAPGDWTACFAQVNGAHQSVRSWYRVVPTASSEPSTYTFGGPSSVARRAVIYTASGVDNTTPLDATPTTSSNVTTTVVKALSITTVTADSVVVWIGSYDSSTFTITAPGTTTQRFQATTGYRVTVADFAQVSPGATGDKDGSASTARGNIGVHIALRPAGATAAASYLPPSRTQRTVHVRR